MLAHGSSPHLRCDGFVGRDAELDSLCAALARAQEGRAGLTLIRGEAGIGKTRLAEQLAAHAQRQDTRVVWGHCWEGEGAPAFWPWRQVLRALVRNPGADSIACDLQATARDLARLVPEIGLPSNAPADLDVAAPEARFRLFDAVTTFLDLASRSQPLLIILEDLHWADVPSVLLLRFVVRHGMEARLFAVATYREGDVAPAAPLSGALAALSGDGQCMRLHGLTAMEAEAFIEAATGMQPPLDFSAAVMQRTEGNPLFLGEMVRALQEHGSIATGDAQAAWRLPLPVGLRAAIRQRVARLPLATRSALSAAAVSGVEFDAAVVERALAAAGTDVGATDFFGEALAAGVLRAAGGARHYRFSHALVRETLYEDLAEPARRRLHRHLTEVLEAEATNQVGVPLAALARHFLGVGDGPALARAAEYATRAADEARALLAYEEAAQLYTLALDACSRACTPASDPGAGQRQQFDLLLSLGEVQRLTAEKNAARATFSKAAALARALADAPRLAQVAIGNAGSADVTVRIDDEAVALLEEARLSLGTSHPELCAQLLSRLAMAHSFAGTPERAAALSAEAVRCAQQAGDERTLATAVGARRFVLLGPDDRPERQQLTETIVTLAERLDDKELRGGGQFWRLLDLLEQGDGGEVDATLARYARMAAELRQPFLAWRSRVLQTMRLLLAGRFSEAEAALEEARRAGERAQTPNALLVYGAQLFELRRQQGRLTDVQSLLEPFAAQHAEIAAVRCGVALIQAHLGRREAALAVLQNVVTVGSSSVPRDGTWLGAMNALAHVAVMFDDRAAAQPLYDWLQPYAERCIVIGFGDLCHGAIARALGLLAALLEHWDAAAAHFEAALAMNRRLGAPPLVAHVQREYAEMCLASGRSPMNATIDGLLREANDTYRALGMEDQVAPVRHCTVPVAVSCTPQNLFQHQGEYWVVGYAGRDARVRDRRGLRYIARLLREPGREFHVADLAAMGAPAPSGGPARRRNASTLAVPDAQARAAYRERLVGLERDAEEAERFNDPGRAHAARAEIEHLRAELAQRYGRGSDARERNTEVERIRKAVTKCIRAALTGITAAHPALGRHLRVSLRTGTFCSYAPEQPTDW
jgi:tetratricopeptide (TPR) repeat protein